MRPDYWRQMDFYNTNRNHHVIVVGAGSIGSYTAFGLARMGVKKITVVDFDKVEQHNLPNQFFAEKNMGEEITKTLALKNTVDLILEDNPISVINAKIENVLPDLLTLNPNAIVVTVDNMKTRKNIYDIIMKEHTSVYVIDGRVGGEMTNVYCCYITPEEYNGTSYYEKSLYDDSEVEDLPCTARSVIDLSFGVAGQLINRTRHILMGKDAPFHTFHDYKVGQAWVMEYGDFSRGYVHKKEDVIKIGGSDGEINTSDS